MPHQDEIKPENDKETSISGQPDLSEVDKIATHEIEPVEAQLLPWRLIEQKYLGLAYYACQALDELDHRDAHPPGWLLRAAALGPHIRTQDPHCDLLQQDFSRYDARYTFLRHPEFNFLLAAATLTPALLAPNLTNAPTLLAHVKKLQGLDALHHCLEAVKGFSARRCALKPKSIQNVEWGDRERDLLREEARTWFEAAQTFTNRYQSATRVWRTWIKTNEPIGQLMEAILQDNPAQAAQARDIVRRFSDDRQIPREIPHNLKRKEIEGSALQDLIARAREAAQLGERWLGMVSAHTGNNARDDAHEHRLIGTLQEHLRPAAAELEQLQAEHPGSTLGVTAEVLRRALLELEALIEGEDRPGASRAHLTFKAPLLWLGQPLDENGYLACEADGTLPDARSTLSSLLRIAQNGAADWEEAYRTHHLRRDHHATGLIVETLRELGEEEKAQMIEDNRREMVDACRRQLTDACQHTTLEIERAFALGYLPAEARTTLISQVEQVRRQTPSMTRFYLLDNGLEQIEHRLKAFLARAQTDANDRFSRILDTEVHPDAARVLQLIEEGDLHTAYDFMERLVAGESLPEHQLSTAFDVFFPDLQNALIDHLQTARPDWTAIAEAFRAAAGNGGQAPSIGPLDFDRIDPGQYNQTGSVLQAWFSAKQRHDLDDENAKQILNGMGFNVLDASAGRDNNRRYIDLEAETPRPEQVAVPGYGSETRGRYRILCAWDAPDAEELQAHLASLDHNRALVVFYFGRLSTDQRRGIARLSRARSNQKGSTFLVIDDVLLLFLLRHPRGHRLQTLFVCALPFTTSAPYATVAGSVPPEMFYGRKEEMGRILDPKDTCLLYGGRQLGKTALLRHIERTYHTPPEQLIYYLDLNASQIGTSNKPDYIWCLIAASLQQDGVLDENVQVSLSQGKLKRYVIAWLDAHPESRILFLFDEADRFFEYDSQQNYAETHRVKALMEDTQRRFKVVFAGLHNVYRNARDPNQPLHHLQDPICIGPLLSRDDKKDAAALIERPLTALGYRFASPELTPFILSQTNYYPSLIQLYCQQLLRDLQDPRREHFNATQAPPYIITAQHVRDSYHLDLSRRIRKKFELTLDLDQRYALIAYIVAFGILDETSAGDDITGFSVAWVREECLYYWREGFVGSSDTEDIRTLLEEMVGLGVLRQVQTNTEDVRYTVRSPNVLTLLGNKKEVEAELLKERIPKPSFDPNTFRSAMHDGMLAPLTEAQKNALLTDTRHGITMLFGTRASALHRIGVYLQAPHRNIACRIYESGTELPQFENWLNETILQRRTDELTVLLIPETIPWSRTWIEKARSRLETLKSRRTFARIVFLADAATTWRFVHEDQRRVSSLESDDLSVLTLRPWHANALYTWLDTWDVSVEDETRRQISHITDNWPNLLERLNNERLVQGPTWTLNPPVFFSRLSEDLDTILAEFGITEQLHRAVLGLLALFDDGAGVEEDEWILLAEDHPEERVREVILWAESLNLIYLKEHYWHLTAPLKRLLAT